MAETKETPSETEQKPKEQNQDTPPEGQKKEEGQPQEPKDPTAAAIEAVNKTLAEFGKKIEDIDKKNENRYAFIRRKSQKGQIEGEEEEGEQGNLQAALQVARSINQIVASNPDYQELIRNNKVLQRAIAKDPLALLEGDFNSPEEASDAFQDFLDEMLIEGEGGAKKATEPKPEEGEKKAPSPENPKGEEGDAGELEKQPTPEVDDTGRPKTIEQKIADKIQGKVQFR